MQDKLYEKTLARAFNLLSAKPRSIAEIRTRLMEKSWSEEEIVNRVITRLQELGYLNDENFATQYAHSRLVTKPLGRVRLQRDLQRKKISSSVINQALENVFTEQSEDELIDKALTKRIRLRGVPATPEETKKLFDHLLRLGFKYDLVRRKIHAVTHLEIEPED